MSRTPLQTEYETKVWPVRSNQLIGAPGPVSCLTLTPIQKHICLFFRVSLSGRKDQMPVHFSCPLKWKWMLIRNIVTLCPISTLKVGDAVKGPSADLSPKQGRQLSQGAVSPFGSVCSFSRGSVIFGSTAIHIRISKVMATPPDRPAVAFVYSVHASKV